MLVWYEQHDTRLGALTRERQMKKWNRTWKIELIEKMNSFWSDLYEDLLHERTGSPLSRGRTVSHGH
jgi:putative endonuclease